MSTIFISGCTAPVPVGASNIRILDPCNCSSYYVQVTNPRPNRQLRVCPGGELWHYQDGECRPLDSVMASGVCNRKVPWDRCQESTSNADGDAFRAKMEDKCIKSGRYNPKAVQGFRDQPGYLLTVEAQYANIELVAASFVAGCVVTLIIVAMVLTICGLPSISLPKRLQWKTRTKTKSSKKRTKVSKKSSRSVRTAAGTDGDNVSVLYEDIDGEEEQQRERDRGHAQVTTTTRVTTTTKTKSSKDITPGPSSVSLKVGLQPPTKPVPFPKHSTTGAKFETNLARKPPAPKTPPKARNPDSPRARAAMAPPGKKTSAAQQPSFGYLHPT